MEIQPFVTPGLGDSSWLLGSDGEAVLVDPQRDVKRFLDAADRRGWRITHIVETHCHNDYVSGALEVRAATGAELVLPARGGYVVAHTPADEGTTLSIGDLRLTAMATPGHTPEHLSWQVFEAGESVPSAVLSGGSLLAGSAGRTDLLGRGRIEELTRAQHTTLRRFAGLPDEVRILPTHGSGSFCSAGPPRVERETSIGEEKLTNPLLRAVDAESFRALMLRDLSRTPGYFGHVASINRAGPALLSTLQRPGRLSADVVAALMASGVVVVDARDRWSFAAAHIPGSIHVEGTEAFASWVGAVVPFRSYIVLVAPDDSDSIVEGLTVQLRRVGYDAVIGSLDGGIDAWAGSGRALRSQPAITAADLAVELETARPPAILDVRQPSEWSQGTLPGSVTVFVGDLPGMVEDLDHAVEWTVVCRSGARASIASSILGRHGLRARVVAAGGVPDLLGSPSAHEVVPARALAPVARRAGRVPGAA